MPNRTPNYSVDRTLTELNPNNWRILRTFPEFYELFPNFTNYSRIFPKTIIFLLSCRTEISDPNNSESFPNYTQIISKSRIFGLAESNPNNSFVTMPSARNGRRGWCMWLKRQTRFPWFKCKDDWLIGYTNSLLVFSTSQYYSFSLFFFFFGGEGWWLDKKFIGTVLTYNMQIINYRINKIILYIICEVKIVMWKKIFWWCETCFS